MEHKEAQGNLLGDDRVLCIDENSGYTGTYIVKTH